MNTIPDSVSFSQLCSFLKAKVSQDDFAQEVALDWEDRLSEILFEFERPDTSPYARNGIRHGPCSAITGVSEASNRRGHPIPVVDGLASHPPIASRGQE